MSKKNTNFSEEKECKCCHEWWYPSEIKQDLCPNCYDYFKQLKQQLTETEQKFLEFQEDSIRNEQTYVIELAEKDEEIEKLKQQYTILENENGKLTTELIMDKYKKTQKEVSFGKQLAISELEKVKMLIEWKFNSIVEVREYLQQQISELKGE